MRETAMKFLYSVTIAVVVMLGWHSNAFAQKTIFVRANGLDANDGLTEATAKLTIASAIGAAATNDNDVIDIGPGNFTGAAFAKDVVFRGANAGASLATWGDETVITSSLDYGASTVSIEGVAFGAIAPVVSSRYVNISNCKFRESNTISLDYGVAGFEVRVLTSAFDGNINNGGGVTVGNAIRVQPSGSPNMCGFTGLMSLTVLETTFDDYDNGPISGTGYMTANIKNNEFVNCNTAETGTAAAVYLSPYNGAACAMGLANTGEIGDAVVTNNKFIGCRNAVRVVNGDVNKTTYENSMVSYNLFKDTPAGYYAIWLDNIATQGQYNSFGASSGVLTQDYVYIRDIVRGHGAYGPYMQNETDTDNGAIGFAPDWSTVDGPVRTNNYWYSFFTIQSAIAASPANTWYYLYPMEYDVTTPPTLAGLTIAKNAYIQGDNYAYSAKDYVGDWPTIRGAITFTATNGAFRSVKLAPLTQSQINKLNVSSRPSGVTLFTSNATGSIDLTSSWFEADPVAALTSVPTAGAIVINREGTFSMWSCKVSRPVSVGAEAQQYIRAITCGPGNGSRNVSIDQNLIEGTIQISGLSLLSSVSVTNNTIDNSATDGVSFAGNTIRDAWVTGNTISNSRQNGISIRDRVTVGSTSAVFSSNLISGSGASGSGFAGIQIYNPSYGTQSFTENAFGSQSGTNKAFINGRVGYLPLATCNWWGSSSEDDILNTILGSVAYDDGTRGWRNVYANLNATSTPGYFPDPALSQCSVRSYSISLAPSNATCFGSATGSIATTLTGAGSHNPTPATYDWTQTGVPAFRSTQQNPANLAAGTYTVAVTSNTGNLRRKSAVILEPTQLTGTPTAVDATCNGRADGGIKILDAAGGLLTGVISTQTYNYRIDNISGTIGDAGPQSSEKFFNLIAGTYDCYVVAAGVTPTCEVMVGKVEVRQPAPITATVTKSNISCNAANNGSITVTNPAGGLLPGSTATLTYSYRLDWRTGTTGDRAVQASGSFTNLIPGTYDVYVSGDGITPTCESLVSTQVILEPSQLAAVVSKTNASCNGANNGTITLSSVSGGTHAERSTQSYTYRIDRLGTTIGDAGPQASASFSNLAPGTYDVYVIASGVTPTCEVKVSTQTILEPSVLTATVAKTNFTCAGANDGTISLSGASGGTHAERATQTYSYRIDRLGTTVGDAGPQVGASFTGLPAGTYDVYVIATGITPTCEVKVSTQNILDPTAITATVAKTNFTCINANDGTITVTSPAGGTQADAATRTYQYMIARSGGSTTGPQASGSFTNLVAGTYTVSVVALATGSTPACTTAVSTQVILNPTAITATVAKTNFTCNNANDGTITVSSPAGGTQADASTRTYNYIIARSGGSTTPAQASGSFTGLVDGTYTVSVVALATGSTPACTTAVSTQVILNPTAITANTAKTNITCNNANDGAITVSSAAGGTHTDAATRTYQYMIARSGGATTGPQASTSFTGLVDGTYTVSVVALASGSTPACTTAVGTQVIMNPTAITATVAKTNFTCINANDGTITVTSPAGGTQADAATRTYQFIIARSGGSTTPAQASGSFTGLVDGTYTVSVVALATGSTPACTTAVSTQVILNPTAITATVAKTNFTCNNANDGTITVTSPAGGTQADASTRTYNYIIARSGGSTTPAQASGSFTNLVAGTYTVSVVALATGQTPACTTAVSTQVILNPTAITANTAKTNITCNNANDGTITVSSAAGGTHTDASTRTYQYMIARSGGATTGPQASSTFAGLTAGTYTVSVVALSTGSSPACTTAVGTQVIMEPTVLTGSASSTNVTCNGSNNGTITVSAAAGGLITGVITSQTYTYRIDRLSTTVGDAGPQAAATFNNLAPGTYDVYVVASGVTPTCEVKVSTRVITEPTPVASNPQVTSNYNGAQLSCPNSSDGSLAANAAGGTPPYTYLWEKSNSGSWSTVGTSANITGQSAGTFRVRVTDAQSCTITNSVQIIGPAQTIILGTTKRDYNGQDISCFGASDGQITVNASGGTNPLEFSRNNGSTWQSSNVFSGLAAGTYTMLVRDVNACASLPLTVTVSQPTAVSITSLTQNGPVNAGSPIEFTATITGGTQRPSGTKYVYSWSRPRVAAQNPLFSTETGSSTVTAKFTIAATTPDDNGQYLLTVTDLNGCQKSTTVTVIVYPSTIYVATTGSDITGDGRQTNPLRTIQKANDVAAAGNTIEVQSGTFSESPVITKQITINATATTALGTGNFFVYGTTSTITWGTGWSTSTWDNLGINTAGAGALQTVYSKVNGGTGSTLWFIGSPSISQTLTIDKALTLRGATSSAGIASYTGCDIEPPATITFTGTGADSILFKFTGSTAKSIRDLTLRIPFAGKFAMVDVGSSGDVSPVDNVRFEWDNNSNTADGYRRIYGVTNGSFTATEKFDVAKFINDAADEGYGTGRVVFGANGPLPWNSLATGWKAEDGGSATNLARIRTLEPMKGDIPLQQTVSTTRRPTLYTTGTVYNSKYYLGFDDAYTQSLEGNKSDDIVGGDQKAMFIVFRPLVNTAADQVVYKHGDDDEGMSVVHLSDGRISLNIYNGATNATRESWIFESGVTHSSTGFDDQVLIAQIYFNGNGDLNADRRVGASLDASSGRITTEVNHAGADKTNGYVASGAFTPTTLTTPVVAGPANVTSMGARSGSMYYASWNAAAAPPAAVNNSITATGRSLYYKGSIAEVVILKDASITMRDATYCYLRNKYFSGDQSVENGLDKRVVAGDDRGVDESLLAWPNPADGQLSFEAVIPQTGMVRVTLRDALGKPVRVLFEEHVLGGTIIPITRQVDDVMSGFYMVHLEAAGEISRAVPVVIRH
ncbi:MAG: hypothetical protein FGM32_05160 [Candidatus Kapabacteria bacterium]|nr:hypothetical protein [Candidatus Kapabacteria bacterium]